jgi:hypothetical protein
MGIEAIYKGKLHPDLVERAAEKLQEWKIVFIDNYGWVKLYPPSCQGSKVHVFSKGTTKIYCKDYDQLRDLEDLINRAFASESCSSPLGELRQIREMGKRPTYYETREQVIKRLTSDPNVVYILNLDKELDAYPEGDTEKARVLGLHLAAYARLWGPATLEAFKHAVKAKTLEEGLAILLAATPLIYDDQVSYFRWLMIEHRDVATEAIDIACNILADLLNRNVAADVLEAMLPKGEGGAV